MVAVLALHCSGDKDKLTHVFDWFTFDEAMDVP